MIILPQTGFKWFMVEPFTPKSTCALFYFWFKHQNPQRSYRQVQALNHLHRQSPVSGETVWLHLWLPHHKGAVTNDQHHLGKLFKSPIPQPLPRPTELELSGMRIFIKFSRWYDYLHNLANVASKPNYNIFPPSPQLFFKHAVLPVFPPFRFLENNTWWNKCFSSAAWKALSQI